MSEQRAKRLQTVFAGALELDDLDQAAYLDVQCGSDAAMRAELDEMLVDYARTGAAPDRQLGSLLERLKERKLVQWTLAYLAAGWVLLEVFGFVADNFAWPPYIVRSLIVAGTVGLPITMVLAWYHGEKGLQRVTGVELAILALLLGAGGIALTALGPSQPQTLPDEFIAAQPEAIRRLLVADSRPSLAVIPFLNRSSPDEQYLTDGMHDEILTGVSRISGLRAIPRTSVEAFRNSTASVLEIGTKLAVTYLLQGSVQRANNQIRVSVQLVDATTENHLWSDQYLEPITPENLFDIQARVTEEVARELRLVVTHEEEMRYLRSATTSTEANDWYLKALAHWRPLAFGGLRSLELVDEQTALLQQALDADPEFGRAHVQSVQVHLNAFAWGVDRSANRVALAKRGLQRACQFSADDPRLPLIEAEYLFTIERDYERALEVLIPGAEMLGRDEDYYFWKGVLERQQGDWASSTDTFKGGVRLNPRNTQMWVRLGTNHAYLRRFREAEDTFRTVTELEPSNALAGYALGLLLLQRDGDLRGFRTWAETTNIADQLSARILALYFARDWDDLRTLLAAAQSDVVTLGPVEVNVRPLWLARAALAEQNETLAQQHAGEAIRFLSGELDRQGEDRRLLRALALAHAIRKDAAAANQALDRALKRLPFDGNPLESGWIRRDIAAMHALLGQRDQALEAINDALSNPGIVTVPMVELNPKFDWLSDDPKFLEVLNRHRVTL